MIPLNLGLIISKNLCWLSKIYIINPRMHSTKWHIFFVPSHPSTHSFICSHFHSFIQHYTCPETLCRILERYTQHTILSPALAGKQGLPPGVTHMSVGAGRAAPNTGSSQGGGPHASSIPHATSSRKTSMKPLYLSEHTLPRVPITHGPILMD